MKKIFIFIIMVLFAFGCDTGRINNNNPNIPNYTVNLQINLNLPGNSSLQFPSNHIVDYSQGARGIVIFNAGNYFVAYDLACPNQPYSGGNCNTAMTISGIEATCGCDNTVYNLFSGQCPGQQYPMKQYRVDVSGNYLIVTN
jgi:nitrite reductase/ring-hydroxylating ferredoxin subunit